MSFSPKKYFFRSSRSCPIEGSIFLCLQIIFLSTSYSKTSGSSNSSSFFEVEKILTLCRGSNFKVAVEEVIFLVAVKNTEYTCKKKAFFRTNWKLFMSFFSSGESGNSFLLFFLSKSVRSNLLIRKSSLKKFDCDIVVLKIRRTKRKIFEVEDNVLQQWRSWWSTWSTDNFSRK